MGKKQLSFCEDTYFEFNNLKAFLILGLSIVYYVGFILSSDLIHSIHVTSIDVNSLSPWEKWTVSDNDGIELYIMAISFPILLFCVYSISISKKIKIESFQSRNVLFVYFTFLFLILNVYLISSIHLNVVSLLLFLSTLLFFYLLFYVSKLHLSNVAKLILNIVLFLFVIILGLFINNNASILDYSYIMGPTNKLLEGERLGTFFIQYDILTSMIVLCMQKMHLLIQQMQLIMIIIFAIWILLYKKLVVKLFQNKIVIYSFIFVLLIFRGIAIQGGPVFIPQTGPMRLDLWVPLLLVLLSFGFESIITAIIFSLAYLCDDVFGLLYLLLYLFSLIAFRYSEFKMKRLTTYFLLSIPVVIALIIHFILFKTIASPAGKLYANLHLGFTPIMPFSVFWLLVLIIPICLYILIQEKKQVSFTLFILGLLCIQLIYFFGRSHENNLRNISGIIVFIIFLTIDKIYSSIENRRLMHFIMSLLLSCIVIYNNKVFRNLRYIIKDKINYGIFREYNIEKQIQKNATYLKTLHTNKILFISDYDGYLNYRLGYRQIGFYSPFSINLKNDETVTFLYNEIKDGYRLIIYPASISPFIKIEDCLVPYNIELKKKANGIKFQIVSLQNNLEELQLIRIQKSN